MKKLLFGIIAVFLLLSSACSHTDTEEFEGVADPMGEEDTAEKSGTQEPDGIMIEGINYDQADIDYFTLIEKVKIEMSRHNDEHLDESNEHNNYWDDQIALFENENVQLQNIIEIVSIALLAEEKNYFIPDEKLQSEVDHWQDNVDGIEKAEQMIQEADEDVYKRKLREYIRLSMLRDRVVDDLVEELQEENPEWDSNEMNYALDQMYQDLYMDQLSSIQIEINLE